MTKYVLTSINFAGQITFGFDVNGGRLLLYTSEAELSPEQHDYILLHLPKHLNQLEKFKSGTTTITEIPTDISWDRFWDSYALKLNAKRCKPLWEDLNDHDKMMAIVRVSHYRQYVKSKKTDMCNPERYLRDRYFDTDFLRLKAA